MSGIAFWQAILSSSDDYEQILSVIRQQGRTFETIPQIYRVHDEESLRDILLAHLNGYDQEDEWGETFRKIGKTDIQIETEKRAVFMAACTVWRDSKAISDSIDQLLSHLMWRDCKAAMMIFNKDEPSFSEILKKLMCVSGG